MLFILRLANYFTGLSPPSSIERFALAHRLEAATSSHDNPRLMPTQRSPFAALTGLQYRYRQGSRQHLAPSL
jgi:hypothetical protein